VETDCKGCGWLMDRIALTEKALRVTIPRSFGRCGCIDTAQGDDADTDGITLALYDATNDDWVGSRNLQTCCGCVRITIQVNPAADPMISASLCVNKACDAGSGCAPYNYNLKFLCCGHDTALFAGAGPQNCGPLPNPPPCDNQFEVLVECVDKRDKGCDCAGCKTSPGLFFLFDASGFSDCNLDGCWVLSQPLPPSADDVQPTGCSYASTCPGGPTLHYTPVDPRTGTWTLTIGGFSYTASRNNFHCDGTSTLGITSPSGDAPSTITLRSIGSIEHDCRCCDDTLPSTLHMTLVLGLGHVTDSVTLTHTTVQAVLDTGTGPVTGWLGQDGITTGVYWLLLCDPTAETWRVYCGSLNTSDPLHPVFHYSDWITADIVSCSPPEWVIGPFTTACGISDFIDSGTISG
jgi:hypothetical protein